METPWSRRLSIIGLDVLAGFVFIAANFSGILRHVARSEAVGRVGLTDVLTRVSLASRETLGTSTSTLYEWLTICFLGLWLYFGVLAILTLVRGRPSIAGFGVGGLLAGTFSFAVLSWLGMLVWGILWVVGQIFTLLGFILHAIGEFFGWVLLHVWPVLAIAAAIALIVFLWKQYGPLRL